MAIAAGTIENRRDRRRHLRARTDCLGFINRRISSRRTNYLDAEKQHNQRDADGLHNSPHGAIVSTITTASLFRRWHLNQLLDAVAQRAILLGRQQSFENGLREAAILLNVSARLRLN